jgi:hypothetical protein
VLSKEALTQLLTDNLDQFAKGKRLSHSISALLLLMCMSLQACIGRNDSLEYH